MFDFTSMYAAENACRAKKIVTWKSCESCACADHTQPTSKKMRKTGSQESLADVNGRMDAGNAGARVRESLLLVGLVGDSLLEPFWPTGSGCGRGFLSAMDSAWMVRQWAAKDCTSDQEAALTVLKEREAIYRLLGQTKSENLSQNYAAYTLNPISRYPNLNSSTVFPHECRHLLYDDIEPPAAPAESARLRRQMMAAKRARRATIASSSPFSAMLEEKPSLAVRDSVPLPVPEDLNSLEQSLEDSFADFESNYRGLMEKSTGSSSSSNLLTTNSTPQTSSSTLVNSGSHSRSSAFNEMMLSPSASNLATLGRSRAKDIEAALRHRRQQQLAYNRSDSSYRSSSSTCNEESSDTTVSHSNTKETSQQLKNKMAWLLEQKNSSSTPSVTSSSRDVEVAKEVVAPFASRVRNLEAKFHANSGLQTSESSAYEESDQKKRIMSKGSNVMTAATTLEQLLNPTQQEVRLKEKASDYRKKTHDIKVVMKMTKETDWNKKCWEEREKQAAGKILASIPRDLLSSDHRKRKSVIQSRIREIMHKISQSSPPGRCQSRFKFTPRRFVVSRAGDQIQELNGVREGYSEADEDEGRVTNRRSAVDATSDSCDSPPRSSLCSYLWSLFCHLTSFCFLITFALLFSYSSFHYGL